MQQPTQQTHWWQAVDRRTFGKGALAFATLASMSGCRGEEEVTGDALSVQQKHGWNVGAEDSRLFFVGGTQGQDYTGSADWRAYTDPKRLMAAWKPRTETWQSLFVPTLMQSLQQDSLRTQMRPVLTKSMQDAFGRGETVRQDFLSQVTNSQETLFIADLPGPEAVAFGAGMAGGIDLLAAFDNWPHPYGVVRSHETLGALLTYASYVQKQQEKLPASAPALLLLDSTRLAPYKDAGDQFDNRYLISGLSAGRLQQRGIKQVLYIVPNRQKKDESDDLNQQFVEYKDAGIAVNVFPLSDLQKKTEEIAQKASDGTTRTVRETHYYYGGGHGSHMGWFLAYALFVPRPYIYYPAYAGGGFGGRRTTLGDVRRTTTARAPSYQPRARPTMFSGTRVGGGSGVGKVKPSGFGQTTVRSSGGKVTGIGSKSAARSSGRSGSFGRGGTTTS